MTGSSENVDGNNVALKGAPGVAGFTLMELLVVIAIIGILASLLLPVLTNAKKRGGQAVCISNQKELALGMKLYVDDNSDAFPGISSRAYGYHPEDWIYWRTNNNLYPSYGKSPILTSIPGLQKPALRCPLDLSDSDRLTYHYDDSYGPYLFSYSFTGYGLDANGRNRGMSSVVDTSGGVTNKSLFKESAVRSPGNKIMLAEEPGTVAEWDNPAGASINSKPIVDGRWIPGDDAGETTDLLTKRHGGKADVAFTDGHVAAVSPQFGANINNSLPER